VHVHVDEPRQHVLALGIDLVIGVQRRPRLVEVGRGDRADPADPVALDDDVDRALRLGPGAVDERGAADDERAERPGSLVWTARRRRLERLLLLGDGRPGRRAEPGRKPRQGE
jgi:hypothetical protein